MMSGSRSSCVTLAAAAGLLLAAAGCGAPDSQLSELSSTTKGKPSLSAAPSDWSRRFVQAQIDAVYSEEVDRGKPVSRPPVFAFYDNQNQAPDLAREMGPFNRAAELRAYINLNQDPLFLAPTRWVVAMEAVSGWSKMRNAKGEPVFREAVTIDASGNRLPDSVDGELTGGKQTHFARVRIPVQAATVTADIQVDLENNGRWLNTKMVNVREIRAPLVGTIINQGGFRILIELYPYRSGFLVYGATAAKLEKLADQMKPEDLGAQIGAILNWLTGQLLGQRALASVSSYP